MPIDYDMLVAPLINVMRQFVAGEIARKEFEARLMLELGTYQCAIRDHVYAPLRWLYSDFPEFTVTGLVDLGDDEAARRVCVEALERLPQEALDRSTRPWIKQNLLDGEDGLFTLKAADGRPRFGEARELHRAPAFEGLLYGVLNHTFRPPAFSYSELLEALRGETGGELATWVYITEPDGALGVLNFVSSLGDVYAQPNQVEHIERSPAEEGGGSYLVLLPKSRSWLLVTEWTGDFVITVHGASAFVDAIAERLGERR